MRTLLFFGVGLFLALQMSACFGCRACIAASQTGSYRPVTLDAVSSTSVADAADPVGSLVAAVLDHGAPQSAGDVQWSVGPDVAMLRSDGSSEFGFGGQAICEITGQPFGLAGGATYYFPEVGNSYGAWGGYRYNVDSGDGPVDFFGLGAAVWSHYGYDTDGYEIPDEEFGLGGGAALQQGFGGGGNAFGVRLGAGAKLADDGRRVVPYGEVGYDVFLLGDDFDNQARIGAGLSIKVGGP